MDDFVVASYGGGVNSTAMLIGMVERHEPVDLILFADTGGEREQTYKTVEQFSKWLKSVGYPEIITVKATGKTLEQDCLDRKALPSIAFGFKTCSQRHKAQPQQKFLNNHEPAKGKNIVKLIGFDADEPQRAKPYPGNRYPLIEWDWGREECIKACMPLGMEIGKSACFYCPSSKKHEILALPESLKARAIAMEDNAELHTIKGLGRDFAWKDLIKFNNAQCTLFPESVIEIDCGCYDG